MKTLLFIVLLIPAYNLNAQSDLSLNKLNELYYNINDYDFHGFSANIELDLLDQLKKSVKDSLRRAVLENIVFKVDFFNKDSIDFNTSGVETTGNEQIDESLEHIVNGTEQSVKGFLKTWSEY